MGRANLGRHQLRGAFDVSSPPKTRIEVAPAEAEDIRTRVRNVDPKTLSPHSEIANARHAQQLVDLLSDPAVSGPIYDLPRPINLENVYAWIAQAEAERRAGTGLLFVTLNEAGQVVGYSKFTIWPDLASGEIAGGKRADQQNSGQGSAGAGRSFGWMFEVLGLRLIGVTAALDNVRSARVIEAAGFTPMGERDSVRPDGSIRRSRYWELSQETWVSLTS